MIQECKRCRGRGQVPDPDYTGRDPAYVPCPACGGDGEIGEPGAEPWDELTSEERIELRVFFK